MLRIYKPFYKPFINHFHSKTRVEFWTDKLHMFCLNNVHCGQWFDSEVSPWAHVFAYLIARWWHCFGRLWSLTGRHGSLVSSLWRLCPYSASSSGLLLLILLRWEQAMLQVSATMQLGVWLTHLPCRDELSSWNRCLNQPFLPQVISARHLAPARSFTDPRPSYMFWDAFASFELSEVCRLWLVSPRTQQPCKGVHPWEPWELMPLSPLTPLRLCRFSLDWMEVNNALFQHFLSSLALRFRFVSWLDGSHNLPNSLSVPMGKLLQG